MLFSYLGLFKLYSQFFFQIIIEYSKEYLKVPKGLVTMEDLKNQRQIHSTMKEKKSVPVLYF